MAFIQRSRNMKKVTILFLALFLMVTVADAGTWVVRPATMLFNDCPTQLTVVRYGLNYITSGENEGEACVYVTVNPKASVFFGCAYFKVYGPTGNLIYKAKKRLRATEGIDRNVFAYVPADDVGGSTGIYAQIGVGCDCNKAGY
jgi:hypothetical protein